MSMNVIEFKREGWRDVVGCLRKIADEIESGELPPMDVCCVLAMDGSGEVFTFGAGEKADDLQVLGMIRLGEQSIIDSLLSE